MSLITYKMLPAVTIRERKIEAKMQGYPICGFGAFATRVIFVFLHIIINIMLNYIAFYDLKTVLL